MANTPGVLFPDIPNSPDAPAEVGDPRENAKRNLFTRMLSDPRVLQFMLAMGQSLSTPRQFGESELGGFSRSLTSGFQGLELAREVQAERERQLREEHNKAVALQADVAASGAAVEASQATTAGATGREERAVAVQPSVLRQSKATALSAEAVADIATGTVEEQKDTIRFNRQKALAEFQHQAELDKEVKERLRLLGIQIQTAADVGPGALELQELDREIAARRIALIDKQIAAEDRKPSPGKLLAFERAKQVYAKAPGPPVFDEFNVVTSEQRVELLTQYETTLNDTDRKAKSIQIQHNASTGEVISLAEAAGLAGSINPVADPQRPGEQARDDAGRPIYEATGTYTEASIVSPTSRSGRMGEVPTLDWVVVDEDGTEYVIRFVVDNIAAVTAAQREFTLETAPVGPPASQPGGIRIGGLKPLEGGIAVSPQ